MYREIKENEIERALFKNFFRYQEGVKCRRLVDGKWTIQDAPFVDDWNQADHDFLAICLKNTVNTGGFVYGAFYEGMLKGFVSVESKMFGGDNKYLDLTSIHVSEDMRRHGIGKKLFAAAKEFAKGKGARKLYISAHPAIETQAFYESMGCVEAKEYNQMHTVIQPLDCQLECSLIDVAKK